MSKCLPQQEGIYDVNQATTENLLSWKSWPWARSGAQPPRAAPAASAIRQACALGCIDSRPLCVPLLGPPPLSQCDHFSAVLRPNSLLPMQDSGSVEWESPRPPGTARDLRLSQLVLFILAIAKSM